MTAMRSAALVACLLLACGGTTVPSPSQPAAATPAAAPEPEPARDPLRDALRDREPDPEPPAPAPSQLDQVAASLQLAQVAGLEAALLPRPNDSHQVLVTLRFRHGDAASLTGKQAVGDLVGEVAQRGTTKRDHVEIAGDFGRLAADVDISSNAGTITVRIETIRDSLPEVLEVVAELLAHPGFRAADLDAVRRERLAALDEADQDPPARAFKLLTSITAPWPKGDVRGTASNAELKKAMRAAKVGDLKAYHRAFWGTGHGELVAVGDFDPAELTASLERHFGAWRTKAAYVRAPDQSFGLGASEHVVDMPGKDLAVVLAAHDLALDANHADAPALLVATRLVGGNAGRLAHIVRQEHAIAVFGSLTAGDQDAAGAAVFGAIAAPEHLGQIRTALFEELQRLVDRGVTGGEVAAAQSSWLAEEERALTTFRGLVSALLVDRRLGRDPAWHRAERARIAAVTAEDVNRALRAWLDARRLTVILAGDLTKAGLRSR